MTVSYFWDEAEPESVFDSAPWVIHILKQVLFVGIFSPTSIGNIQDRFICIFWPSEHCSYSARMLTA
jgi:hypothetical protein